MILSVHIIAAAVATKPVFQNPGLVFLVALGTHFILDIIPHWDYKLRSIKKDENDSILKGSILPSKKLFRNDLIKIGLDTLIGTLLVLLVIKFSLNWRSFLLLAGLVVGATLPDFLAGVNLFWKKFPTLELTKFHYFIHSKKRILNKKPFWGLGLYIIAIVFLLIFLK